jgi:release factor glutamine methyltransferase
MKTPPIAHQTLAQAITTLTAAGVPSPRLDAELLLAHVLGQTRAHLTAHPETELTPAPTPTYQTHITRRAARTPLVHLTGTREFYGLDLEITPNVLTPRVETEQIVDWAIQHTPENASLIDIGTGSGAIAIAIAKARPDLHITATDLSEIQLTVARRNATRHHTPITFLASDLWESLKPEKPNAPNPTVFQTIVTNLPYLADDADLMPEVTREPSVALFGGPDGLDLYRRFLAGIPSHLAPNGHLFTECDPWQHESLIAEAAKYHLTPIEQGYFILGFRHLTK